MVIKFHVIINPEGIADIIVFQRFLVNEMFTLMAGPKLFKLTTDGFLQRMT